MAFPTKQRPSLCSLLLVLALLATASPGAVSDDHKEDTASGGRFPLLDHTAPTSAPAAPKHSRPFSVASGPGAVPSTAPAPTPPAQPNKLKEEYPYVLLFVLAYAYDALYRGGSLAFAILMAMIGCAVFILGEYPGLVGGAGGGQA